MESSEPRSRHFAVISHAFSDMVLQVRAKPLVFVSIWLLLGLLPQLLLSYVFHTPLSNMIDASVQILDVSMASGADVSSMTSEGSASIFKGMRAVAVMIMLLLLTEIYLGSVLAGVVRQFRGKVLPSFVESLHNGMALFPNFLKAVIASGFRILMRPCGVLLVATVIGVLLNQPVLIYFFFIVSGVLFIMGLLRYGLAPFIHISLGTNGRDSAEISKSYYFSYRPLVSILFMFVILLPIITISILTNLLVSMGLFFGAGGMILGIFQSLLQLLMTVVLINFVMNNFTPHE